MGEQNGLDVLMYRRRPYILITLIGNTVIILQNIVGRQYWPNWFENGICNDSNFLKPCVGTQKGTDVILYRQRLYVLFTQIDKTILILQNLVLRQLRSN